MISRRIQLSIIAFTLVVGSFIFTFCALAHTSITASASSTTSQDFFVPSGTDPWGTAIDNNGHVWVALPGCNPAPTCPSSTPPGKIAEFNSSNSSWMNTYTLPTGYAQPLFLAVDGQGHVWFTENNSSLGLIGEYTSGGKLQEYKIRTNPAGAVTPHLIATDPSGNVWWSEGWAGMIGELKVAQATPGTTNGMSEYAYQKVCASCTEHTSGIGVDSNGLVWFTDADAPASIRAGE